MPMMTLLVAGIMAILAVGWADARAAERSQVMLVLDASGSMWGRVEGREKILIAREVVGGILDDWDPDVDLGVIAYGHRRKGDCADIETVVAPGPADPAAIRRTIEGLMPKGKTPLSAAVQQAARELRYTEERATVILVSDGLETCDADPCAVGEELDRTGVDFTAHVIGFDIGDEERAQLQCLAEATGGRYFDADRADQLQTALAEAVHSVQEQPARLQAALVEGGEPLADVTIEWRAEPLNGGESLSVSGAEFALPPGDYSVSVRLGSIEVTDRVSLDSADQQLLVLDAGRLELAASARGPEGEVADPAVDWAIQNLPGEFEVTTLTGAEGLLYLPADTYGVFAEFDAVRREEVIRLAAGETATVRFAFEQAGATLTAPDSAAAGGSIEVEWEGPDGRNDYIAVAAPDMPDNRYENYAYTRTGNPLQLLLPDRAGVYELRYFDNTGKQVLGRRPIKVLPITARIETPDEAVAGRSIEVSWEGPDNSNDYIAIAAPDAPDNRYENYTYTRTGNPLQLLLPDQSGIYELRYVSNQSKRVLARRPIVLSELGASLNAPDENPAGQHIEVTWEGPDNRNDYIAVATPDTPDNRHENYTYTRSGNPLQLLLPDQAGIYELRYVSNQSKRVLARRPIVLTRLDADLRALDILPAGQSARVDWQGPDNRNDYIAIALPDQPDNKYQGYAYTRTGNPLQLKLPEQPGAYELRYVSSQSKRVLTRRPVSVVAADEFKSRITAADRAEVTLQALDGGSGAPLESGLNWTLYAIEGPDTELLRSDEARPHYQLPMGVYRVTVQGETGNGSLDFVVNPGETLTRSVTLR